jgi:hypothetical protein
MAVLFQDDCIMPREMKGACHRQAHRARSDNDCFGFELIHGERFCREIDGTAMLV